MKMANQGSTLRRAGAVAGLAIGVLAGAKSKSGLPVVAKVEIDNPHAVPLHQRFAVGFASEVLRTDYLAKQLIREIDVGGHRYADGQRAAARPPPSPPPTDQSATGPVEISPGHQSAAALPPW